MNVINEAALLAARHHATALARQMVCVCGMGKSVGLVHCAQHTNPMLAVQNDGALQRDCSEATARAIDEQVRSILDNAYHPAKQILHEHRSALETVANELLRYETIDADTFKHLIQEPAVALQPFTAHSE